MAIRTGLLVANKITKGNTALNYGTHSADEGIGGFFSVADYASIASVPSAQLVDGMILVAQDTYKQWQYQGSSWVDITSSGKYVLLAGDTMTGPLILPMITVDAPTNSNVAYRFRDEDITLPDYSAVVFAPAIDTHTIGQMTEYSGTKGGLQYTGFTGSGINDGNPVALIGYHGGTNPTTAAVEAIGFMHDGADGRTPLTGTMPVFKVLTGLSTNCASFLANGNASVAGTFTATSFIIGANTLDTNEWTNLDGLNQTLATTSSPTFAGLALGAGNLTMTGSLGTTGARLTKGWFTDLEVTNAIVGSVTGNAVTVTTNANLTGPITSVGNATSVAAQTGTGSTFVMDTSPTLVTPNLGVATATSISINTNSATAFKVEQDGVNDDVFIVDTATPQVSFRRDGVELFSPGIFDTPTAKFTNETLCTGTSDEQSVKLYFSAHGWTGSADQLCDWVLVANALDNGNPTMSIYVREGGSGNGTKIFSLDSTGQFGTAMISTAYDTREVLAVRNQISNAAAATVTYDQYSPVYELYGRGWKTAATAGAQSMSAGFLVAPEQGVTNPIGVLKYIYATNATTLVEANELMRMEWGDNFAIGIGGVKTPLKLLDVNGDQIIADQSSLGTEKLTNGTFTGNADSWTLGTGWTYSSNTVLKNGDGVGTLSQTSAAMATPLVAGEVYLLQFTISAATVVDNLVVTCGGATMRAVTTNNGTYTLTFIASSTADLVITPTITNSRFTIDTISLKKITGGDLTLCGDITADNITATSTASKIPIADGSGKLDTWVSDATTAVKGKASFDTNDFTVTSGAVSLKSASVADGDIATDADILIRTITFVIDGGGSAISTGVKGDIEVPFNCTILSSTLLADQSGAIKIDIWKDAYANYPPTDADTITGGNEPEIAASGVKDQDTTLTSWTVAIAAGATLRINVDSCTTITRCTVSLKVQVT